MTSGTPGGHVDRPDVRAHGPPEVHGLEYGPVDAVDRHDDALLAVRALEDEVVSNVEFGLLVVVLAADEQHQRHEDRDQHHDEVGAVAELDAGHDHGHDRRGDAADRVDREAPPPAG
jgi:hypothetical protein